MAAKSLIAFLSVAILPFFVRGDTCLAPQVKSNVYSTSEAVVSSETVFIVEFSLACKNGLVGINLYADIGGRVLPATKTQTNTYQVSVSDEHKKLPAGTYDLRFFDEEGYAALKKAQRSGDSTDSLKPLFTISVNHKGIWTGPVVQTEFVAALGAMAVWWLAYTTRGKLLA